MTGEPRVYTTTEAALECGVNASRIRQLAKDLGVGRKAGRDWIFTETDLRVLKSRRSLVRRSHKPEDGPGTP